MKKTITLLMLLALVMPLWAGEKTVTISRNEGNISEGTGVYYAEKDGIVFEFSGGLDNSDYLLCMQQKTVIIRSFNYKITKIVFHCVDNTLNSDLDSFFWGPTTLSISANASQGGAVVGSYNAEAGSYIGTWNGSLPINTQLTFESQARPVRFASIEVTYEKLEGDIFDLVTNNSQIVEGKTYIIVSQYHDKVMSIKKTNDATHTSADIVGWPLGENNKSKVKVDGEAKIFKMIGVKDSTINSYNRKVAWFYDLSSYIREGSGTNAGNLITASSSNDYCRAIMYISSTEHNYLCWFKNGTGSSSKTIRYDYNAKNFKILSTTDPQQRVWLYKLAESYTITTVSNPTDGGSVTLGSGVIDGTSQEGETVEFTVSPNSNFYFNSVTITDANNNVINYSLDENCNYSFIMPASNVTITANFVPYLYLLGTANGGLWTANGDGVSWLPYGPMFNFSPEVGYYIDVYFKGTGNYGEGTGSAYGYFSLSTRYATDGNWDYLNGHRLVAHQYDYESEDIADGNTKNLYADADNNRGSSFKIPAGIYRLIVNAERTSITVTESSPSLTFDPEGGTVEIPEIVTKDTEVTLNGTLYNKIRDINSNILTPPGVADVSENAENDGNFFYKTVKTIGNDAEANIVNATTSTIATLDVVNDGETVTELAGTNYLGWIHADNTAYYKVINTPLNWIERNGEKGKTYTVADQLQGVYAKDGHLWCKDLGDISIVKTEPAAGQVDYVTSTLNTLNHRFENNMRNGNWDQSNWVELDFTGVTNDAGNVAQSFVNKLITAGSVKGVYSDDVNYTITLSSLPNMGDVATYVPNTYYTNNFIEANLTATGVAEGGKNYYFLNPKVQEYAIITYAMWDVENQIMVAPSISPFNGAAVLGRWDLNESGNELERLDAAAHATTTANNEYEFHIIVQRANKSYGSPATTTQGVAGLKAETPTPKAGQTASAVIMAQPLDLQASSPLPTAINGVVSNAQPVNVEYINLAGVRSSKPFSGVNIVVTRYTDGSTTTTKVIRK